MMTLPVILVIAAVLVIGWVIMLFNGLIQKRNRVTNALSDIDVQLKRRYDVVPNLVETVKAYGSHEQTVFEEVTKARANAMSAQSGAIGARVQAETMLSGALKSLFMVAEDYPELKASENFRLLQEQILNLENDIQSARRYYNATVREFNTAVQVFPSNMIAPVLGFKQSEFFGADENEKQNVKVTF